MSELKKPELVVPAPGSFDAWLASIPKEELMRSFDLRKAAVEKNPSARLNR